MGGMCSRPLLYVGRIILNLTVVLVALIIGFLAVTVFSLMALLYVRRREAERERERVLAAEDETRKTIEDLDVALDAALNEINKMGALVQAEVDEKYKSMLFLYNLVEDKQKEIAEATDSGAIKGMVKRYMDAYSAKMRSGGADRAADTGKARGAGSVPTVPVASVAEAARVEEESKMGAPVAQPVVKPTFTPQFTNPKHKQIWELREYSGKSVPEIARELSMGQGEVKLILNLLDRPMATSENP